MTTKENAMHITASEAASAKAMLRPATQELKENVVKVFNEKVGTETLDLIDLATAATPADIMDTLFMKIGDGQLYRGRYNFYLADTFGKKVVRLGNEEYKYAELDDTSDQRGIQEDNKISDFNGKYVPEYAELYVLNDEFHKSVKVPEMILSNAWLSANNMVEFVQLQVESMSKAVARRWENMVWTEAFNKGYKIETEKGAEVIEHNRAMVKAIEDLGTTSNIHPCIGAGGVITIKTVNGDQTIQPDLYFDASEFMLFVDTEQFVDVSFTAEAQWYNYAATKLNWAKVQPLAFSKYAGFRAILDSEGNEIKPAVVVPTGMKMIAIHKEFVELLEQYTYTETVKGVGPWAMSHNFRNLGIYNIKTKPVLMVVEAAA